ncbi:polyphosphate kinase [Crenobacter luteus]|uniref:Polyphosphate kinase n=1 Tax=Crenobacter luteus TaxID=1452487 RepID=A0A165F6E5_9NEIS|nr:polyphosphate kinase 1 [Crenobacter luteus]KZE31692.1 RNA degradosome polyphosphate kinase [Crenobacter luteus]TCP15555.1 polyphosphate kinase [Crenobacter luteus]
MTQVAQTELLLNRELGLIEFNRRVLAQAEDASLPFLERLKFLCIVSSNLDEFFEVRVAWLKDNVAENPNRLLPDGLTPRQALTRVSNAAHALVREQYQVLNEVLLPALREQDIVFLRRAEWNDAQRDWIRAYFFRELMPILTPIGLDPSHPFPKLLNKSLNFAVELEGRDAFGRASGIAIVQAPRILPRVIRLPAELTDGRDTLVFLSSILHAHVHELFLGMAVKGCYQFRVTRNSELTVEDEDVKNLRTALQGELRHRQFGEAVRLEIADTCPEHMEEFLAGQFGLEKLDVYRVNGPVNLVRLMQVPELIDRPDLKFAPFEPSLPAAVAKKSNLFDAIARGDILLHHPYQSFQPVIDLLNLAATDPQVVAIKMTVYRTGTDSVLMDSLLAAARAGKQVTVVVELMARFDEEANIGWASRLEDAGAHVVYGVFGYKVHAKMLMVVRREEGGLKRYVHLGTGNYHPRTARLYTDFGLLTCNDELASDVNDIFVQLTGLGRAGKLKLIYQSPFTLHSMLLSAIEREAEHAAAGRPAQIIAKMNALLEPQIIHALYKASQAGVKIQLIVRGVCALRPGVPGLSDNISVRSIVGRFLEHTRVFYFFNDKHEDVLIASADWMGRNLFRRIETCVPIVDAKIKRRLIKEGLKLYLEDNVNAWEMQPDGSYRRRASRARPRCAQDVLLAEYAR